LKIRFAADSELVRGDEIDEERRVGHNAAVETRAGGDERIEAHRSPLAADAGTLGAVWARAAKRSAEASKDKKGKCIRSKN
jgi:hypothetical protein